jgi:hypothetical protein
MLMTLYRSGTITGISKEEFQRVSWRYRRLQKWEVRIVTGQDSRCSESVKDRKMDL